MAVRRAWDGIGRWSGEADTDSGQCHVQGGRNERREEGERVRRKIMRARLQWAGPAARPSGLLGLHACERKTEVRLR